MTIWRKEKSDTLVPNGLKSTSKKSHREIAMSMR
jgi:hypothetical protein